MSELSDLEEAEQRAAEAVAGHEWALEQAKKVEVDVKSLRGRAEKAETERDAQRERLDALRADIINGRLLSASEAAFSRWLIARDDERAKGMGQ